ncbi:putative hemolysin [Vibrio sinaloensis]|uniref:putative hemolysin n=1 Tax=Photobacterium sp. (strain ATCC 43367) TaxID=379097 RepID=UPI0035E9ACD5
MKKTHLLFAIVGTSVLAGCASEPDEYEVKEYTSLANPAAVYCVQKGGELDTVSENNQRVTYCVLSDGNRIEQWEYYRNHSQSDSNS